VVVTPLLVTSALFVTRAGAATEPTGSVSVTPAAESSLAPGGGYFLLHATPGQVVQQKVSVTNGGAQSVNTAVRGVDASTAAGTGVVYGTPDETPTRVGSWITPEATTLPVRGRATRSLQFSVRVPPGTAPGQYLGGLSVALTSGRSGTAPPAQPGFGVSITAETQRVIAVEVDVPGAPYAPNLVVRGTRFADVARGRVVLVTIANDGNGFARGSGTISVPEAGIDEQVTVGTFVPGTSADYELAWPPGVAEAGAHVSVALDYDGRSLRWSGTVGPVPPTTAVTRPAAGEASRHRSGVDVGTAVLLAGAAALGVGLVLVVVGRRLGRRRRGKRRRTRSPVRPAPEPMTRSARRAQRSRGGA
jgi:hypothetical protein